MSPKPDVSEKRKSQIITAAQKVFSKLGFHNARMSDIADETGLSKGTLYLYFESKDQIIISLLEKLFEPELQELRKLIDQESPARDRILHYTERVIKDMQRSMKWMPVAYEFLSLAFRRDTVQKVLKKYYREHMKIMVPIIEQGIDRGEFKAHDPQKAAIALGAIYEGTALLWVYDQETVNISDHIHSGVELFLSGLEA